MSAQTKDNAPRRRWLLVVGLVILALIFVGVAVALAPPTHLAEQVVDTTSPDEATPATTSPAPGSTLVEAPPLGPGVALGPSRVPASLYNEPFNGTKLSLTPETITEELEEAQKSEMRVFIVLVGSQRHYRKVDGTFDLDLWKERVDRFIGVDLDSFVESGTIVAHQLVSEGKARSEWGGKVIPNDVLDEMAAHSKSIWPTMPTVLRTDATDLEEHAAGYRTPWPEWEWQYLDAAWSRYLARKGPVDVFAVEEQESADRMGLALVVGLNVFNGGDGSSDIPSPEEGKWAMSANEVVEYGTTLLRETRPCGFGMWRYETPGSTFEDYEYFRRPDISRAMEELVLEATRHPALSCETP